MCKSKWLLSAILTCWITIVGCPVFGQTVTSLDDIEFWIGSGNNETGFVVSWNDPSTGTNQASLAWGYRWDDTAVAEEAVLSIIEADQRLFSRLETGRTQGTAIYGIGYDANDNGDFGVTGAQNDLGAPITLAFSEGIADTLEPFSSTGAGPSDSGDYYLEGWWDNGFWGFYTASGATFPTTWNLAPVGISTQPLMNEGWIALSMSDSLFNGIDPSAAIAAVPEPTTGLLLSLAAWLFIIPRRRCISD